MKPALTHFDAIDTTYDVVAPENVAFKYRVAGAFTRAMAWTLDLTLIFVYFLVTTLTALLLLSWLTEAASWLDDDVVESFVTMFVILNFFFAYWFLAPLMEAFFDGKTLGKKIFGLRVISTAGRPITLGQAFLRNILRTADMALGPFDVLIMAGNDRMARLGDIAAGTIVVHERLEKKNVAKIVFNERSVLTIADNIPDEFASSVSDSTLKALSLYVARRLEISPPRRYEIATPIAAALARKSNFPYRVDPDAFLCALYQRTLGAANVAR